MSLDAVNYDKISHIKEKVLEPALRDINAYSDLRVDVEYEKTGRTISHVVFYMQNLEKAKDRDKAKEAYQRYINTECVLGTDRDLLNLIR